MSKREVREVLTLHGFAPNQAKDRQKKKGGTKGIRIDAEGGASFEDFANPELQAAESVLPDPDKSKSSKKVIIFIPPFLKHLMCFDCAKLYFDKRTTAKHIQLIISKSLYFLFSLTVSRFSLELSC